MADLPDKPEVTAEMQRQIGDIAAINAKVETEAALAVLKEDAPTRWQQLMAKQRAKTPGDDVAVTAKLKEALTESLAAEYRQGWSDLVKRELEADQKPRITWILEEEQRRAIHTRDHDAAFKQQVEVMKNTMHRPVSELQPNDDKPLVQKIGTIIPDDLKPKGPSFIDPPPYTPPPLLPDFNPMQPFGKVELTDRDQDKMHFIADSQATTEVEGMIRAMRAHDKRIGEVDGDAGGLLIPKLIKPYEDFFKKRFEKDGLKMMDMPELWIHMARRDGIKDIAQEKYKEYAASISLFVLSGPSVVDDDFHQALAIETHPGRREDAIRASENKWVEIYSTSSNRMPGLPMPMRKKNYLPGEAPALRVQLDHTQPENGSIGVLIPDSKSLPPAKTASKHI